MSDSLDALVEAYALKDETRTGWQLRGVEAPESVAAHTWGVALLVVRFCPPEVDRERALLLAVVHDVAEAETGDIATRAEAGAQSVDADEKERREREAMAGPLAALGERIHEWWAEYEARETAEARFVKDMDILDTCLQALVYERERRYDPDADNPHFEAYDDLDEFFATGEPRLSTARGRELFEQVRERYETAKRNR
ncbi:HD domain-containing protein [Natronomonas gomsonensis]|uniref:HD domain-containing protein n=1 Tax=Natronomonas gomsonensis TaxID=1046043 RepID=UPI0015B95ED7